MLVVINTIAIFILALSVGYCWLRYDETYKILYLVSSFVSTMAGIGLVLVIPVSGGTISLVAGIIMTVLVVVGIYLGYRHLVSILTPK